MVRNGDVLKTGFRVLLLDVVSGLFLLVYNLVLGIFGVASVLNLRDAEVGVALFALVLLVVMFLGGVYIKGLVARNVLRWK